MAAETTIPFLHQTAAAATAGFVVGALWRINPFIGTAMATAAYVAHRILGAPLFDEIPSDKIWSLDVMISLFAVQAGWVIGLSCIIDQLSQHFIVPAASRHAFTIIPLAIIIGEYVRLQQ